MAIFIIYNYLLILNYMFDHNNMIAWFLTWGLTCTIKLPPAALLCWYSVHTWPWHQWQTSTYWCPPFPTHFIDLTLFIMASVAWIYYTHWPIGVLLWLAHLKYLLLKLYKQTTSLLYEHTELFSEKWVFISEWN